MIDQLTEQVKVVAAARRKVATLRESYLRAFAEYREENNDLLSALDRAEIVEKAAEDTLRALTLQVYEETGNKAPAPGVGIREGEKLSFDEGQALEWGKKHDLAIQLDRKAFEKQAVVERGKTFPSITFVTFTPTVSATIAQDLDKILKEAPNA